MLRPPAIGRESILGVGVGCNSVTLPMSDARISLVASGVGQFLMQRYQEGHKKAGSVGVAAVASDGMSITWDIQELGVSHLAESADDKTWEVRVLDSVHRKILEEIGRYPHVETGGVIVGRISTTTRQIIITNILSAPVDSTRSRNLFVLGVNGLKNKIAEYAADAAGTLWELGTWHSHLSDEGASHTDLNTADILAKGTVETTVLLIRRPTGYSAVIRQGDYGNAKRGSTYET